ncbi:P-loop containing nucleoside triphosphate hydrolase protein [Panaeolus papilionaceus]|nr:P-loop containing nucleoside triphosphate hydrolase protein [Panaeolus papilionaceus]
MFLKSRPKHKSDHADIDPKRPLSKSVSLVDVSSIISAHDEGKEKEKGNMATVVKAALNVLRSKKSRNKMDSHGSDSASDYDKRSIRQGLPSRKGSRSTLHYGADLDYLPDRQIIETLASDSAVSAAAVDTQELDPQDIIFAIMGPTGVGKSSFIGALTGDADVGVKIGHTLKSCTSEISVVRVDIPGTRFRLVLVDTPGFDDSHRNDTEILTVIADWLEKTYNKQVLLSGVIYLHRITDNRFDASTERTLSLFQSLMGTENFERTALVTTMWDQLIDDTSESEATHRQQLLEQDHWYDLVKGGAIVSQFQNSKQSALDILWPLIDKTWRSRATLCLQYELCDEKKQLPKTEVGKQVFSKMDAFLYSHQKRLAELRGMLCSLNLEENGIVSDRIDPIYWSLATIISISTCFANQFLSPWLSSDQVSDFSTTYEDSKKDAKWYRLGLLGLGASSAPQAKRPTQSQRPAAIEERAQPTAETIKKQCRLCFYQDTWSNFAKFVSSLFHAFADTDSRLRCVGHSDDYAAIVCLVDVSKGTDGLPTSLKESSSGARAPPIPIIWVKMGLSASSSDKDKSAAFKIDGIICQSLYAPKEVEEILTFKERNSNYLGLTSEQILDAIMVKLDAGESQLKQKLSALQHASSFGFRTPRTSAKIQTEDLKSTDYIIAVMGPTGAGKSTFINALTGHDLNVGHTLESCTSDISIVTMTVPEVTDVRIVVVDTPGFDDTHKSDLEIFKYISEWLNKTYTKGTLLSGVLYFHRISDNRMAGTPLKNLRMFQSLCGKDAYDKITLVTTMWDDVDESTGETREHELKEKYWKPMIDGRKDRQAQIERFKNTQESAIRVLLKCLSDTGTRQRTLQLQRELDQLGRDLPETHAGRKMYSKLEALYERQQKVLNNLRKELQEEKTDQTIITMLKDEHKAAAEEMEALVHDMQQLKLTIPARLMGHLRSGLDLKWKWGS